MPERSRLIGPAARDAVVAAEDGTAESWNAPVAIAALDRELALGRRLLVGAAASGLLLVAGMGFSGVWSGLQDGEGALALVGGVIGVPLLLVGAGLGLATLRAGRRIVNAYRTWSALDRSELGPDALVRRQVDLRHLSRLAVGVMCGLGATVAATIGVMAVAADADPSDAAMVPLALTGTVALAVPAWSLVAAEFRTVWAHSRRVVRTAQRGR